VYEYITILNPIKNPKYIGLGIITLALAIVLDFYIISKITAVVAYIPLMIMIGFLFRNIFIIIILSGLVTGLLHLGSPDELIFEMFFLRWVSYFFIAYVIRTLLLSNQKEKENLISLTSTLAESIDARDKYTSSHSQNVAYYSREIGKAMNLSSKEYTHLYIGGLLHDIGKIGVPESILNKPSRLTDEEFEKIKQHPQMGYNMLKYIPYFKKSLILDMVLHHHEKFDGTGYPYGLKGGDIPLVARIMAVADAFDAMTSRRVYRDKKDLNYALNQISDGKHSQFDPEIAEIFLELIDKDKIIIRGFKKGDSS
jgi:HD-GYP domain-containing protein (c-di-GMP phosphodiesterase class II)